MFLSPTNALALLRPGFEEFSSAAVMPLLDVADIQKITELTELRHARYAPLAAALGEIALRRLRPRSRGYSRAVITVGENLQYDVAAQFGEQLRRSGPRQVNPLMFPNVLPSSCAVLLGTLYEAHVCSIALEGPSCFHQALKLTRMLLEDGAADEVFLFGCELDDRVPRLTLGFLVSLNQLPGLGPSIELTGSSLLAGSCTGPLGDLRSAAAMIVGTLGEGTGLPHRVVRVDC